MTHRSRPAARRGRRPLIVAAVTVLAMLGLGVATAGSAQADRRSARLVPLTESVSLGDVAQGSTSARTTVVVTNVGRGRSGVPSVRLAGADAAEFGIVRNTCTATLPFLGTCFVTVAFTPVAPGARSATLVVSAEPGGTTTTALTGNGLPGATLVVSPSSATFPATPVGQTSAALSLVFTNTGSAPTGPVTATVSSSDFSLSASSCPAVAPQATCVISVVFTPRMAGPATATVTATGTPGGSASASLSGAGLTPAALTVSPSSVDFGTVPVTTSSAPATILVTNAGGQPAGPVTTALGSGVDYVITSSACTGVVLAANSSCSVVVQFNPSGAGVRTGVLAVQVQGGSTALVQLTGIGTVPAG